MRKEDEIAEIGIVLGIDPVTEIGTGIGTGIGIEIETGIGIGIVTIEEDRGQDHATVTEGGITGEGGRGHGQEIEGGGAHGGMGQDVVEEEEEEGGTGEEEEGLIMTIGTERGKSTSEIWRSR